MEYLFNKVAGLLWGPFSGLQKNNYKKLFHKNVMLRYQTKEIKKCKKGLGRLKLLEVFASDKLELHNFQIYLHEKESSVYYVRKIFSKNVHVRIRG